MLRREQQLRRMMNPKVRITPTWISHDPTVWLQPDYTQQQRQKLFNSSNNFFPRNKLPQQPNRLSVQKNQTILDQQPEIRLKTLPIQQKSYIPVKIQNNLSPAKERKVLQFYGSRSNKNHQQYLIPYYRIRKIEESTSDIFFQGNISSNREQFKPRTRRQAKLMGIPFDLSKVSLNFSRKRKLKDLRGTLTKWL